MLKKSVHIAAARTLGNYKKRWLIFVLTAALAGVVFFAVQFLQSEPEDYTLSRNVFLDNISVNGIDIGGKA